MENESETTAEEALGDLLDYAQTEIGRLLLKFPEQYEHFHERLTVIRAHMIAIDIELLWEPSSSPPLVYDEIYLAARAGNPIPYDRDRQEFFGINQTRH